jgi:shikimate kinase
MSEDLKYKNIFLVGFMGAGKTTVGRVLANKIGYSCVDPDQVLEENAGTSISAIFSEFGEDYFRDLESQTLESISAGERQVIATGGGVVIKDRNWDIMKKSGLTVYLKAPVEVLYERIKDSTNRPLLQVENPLERARELLGSREHLYQKADLIIDSEKLSVREVADELIRILNY